MTSATFCIFPFSCCLFVSRSSLHLQGDQGDDGEFGLPGKSGARGKIGVSGLPGDQGSFGPKVRKSQAEDTVN